MRHATMGFASYVDFTNQWLTDAGRSHFLQKVQNKVENDVGFKVDLEYDQEMEKALVSATASRSNDQHARAVQEAVDYVSLVVVQRLKMRTRLDEIKANMLRLPPRGIDSRIKGDLPMEVLGTNTHYAKFVQQQSAYRTLNDSSGHDMY